MRAMRFETSYRHRFFMFVDRRSPWKQVALSTATQGGIVAALLAMAAPHPGLPAPAYRKYHFVNLVDAPRALSHKVVVARVARAPKISMLTPSLRLLPGPAANQSRKRVVAQKEEATHAQKIELAGMLAPLPPAAPLIPKQVVKTNVFSSGSSEPAMVSSAPRRVETGGFDNSGGVPSKSHVGRRAGTALTGGFDLAAASGSPEGTGVGRIARAGIVDAGFAARTAESGESPRSSRAIVSQTGFGDAGVAAFAQPQPKHTEAVETLPAEIVSKPAPVYSEEAKTLRIEGEVWLEVLFESSGKIQVVRVVRGLGHGLDEAAIQAAQQIRFKPALRDGQPADSTGVLHITFQLA
jgi:TonB family protein